LIEAGYVDLQDYFIDGSKFMANANPHSYVWKKNVARYRESFLKVIDDFLGEIERFKGEENRRYGDRDLSELSEGVELAKESQTELVREIKHEIAQIRADNGKDDASSPPSSNDDSIAQRIAELEEGLDEADSGGATEKKRRMLHNLKEKLLARLQGYEQQQAILGRRGSYSKTDVDATFMRFKGDVLATGNNILMGSHHQFIINYSVHQNPIDAVCFIEPMDKLRSIHQRFPENVVGDRGLGSEENYLYLQRHGMGNYLKDNQFHIEGKHRKKYPYSRENVHYDEERDVFICPEGRELFFEDEQSKRTASGSQRRIRGYRSWSCKG